MPKGLYGKIAPCQLCGHSDVIFPTSQLFLCPKCARNGQFKKWQYVIVGSGYCDVCGVHFLGAGLMIRQAWVCYRCLWRKLGHRNDALRNDGGRIV